MRHLAVRARATLLHAHPLGSASMVFYKAVIAAAVIFSVAERWLPPRLRLLRLVAAPSRPPRPHTDSVDGTSIRD